MCGIVGWVKIGSTSSASGLIKAMSDRLIHRGPDDEGFYFSPGIGIGHRRLSIIDLEHGHQPMVTRDGRFVIVYNGEIYNFPILRRELEADGEIFFTHSDTEVILLAFKRWGPEAFKKFKGMFALAIWDAQEKVIYLARDPLGIKPLYYAIFDNELIFASEIKAIFCHPKIKRTPDPLVMASFLYFNNTFGSDSFWLGVNRCQPGERLRWDKDGLNKDRFFDISEFQAEPFKGNFKQATEEYRKILSDSIDDHLLSDVPVGAYLSSGIDSGTIVSLAARKSKRPMDVFTGYFRGFENTWYDERGPASEIASSYGMTHHYCPIDASTFSTSIEKVAYHLDEPTLGSGAIPQFLVAKQAKSKIKVALTGHGGDELFAGYPVFKAALLQHNGFSSVGLAGLFLNSYDEWVRILYFLCGGITDPILRRGQFRMYYLNSLKNIASASLVSQVVRLGGAEALLSKYQPIFPLPGVDGLTRWYIATYLPTLLIQEDKMSMAHGIEARVPFCYESLLKFSFSLSNTIKLHRGTLKAVPRQAAVSLLPRRVLMSPKRGFPTPIVSWLSGQLGQEWESVWLEALPSGLEGLLNSWGVVREFRKFRRYGHRMPNAYALAHKLVSLQMLLNCITVLQSVPAVKDFDFPVEEMGSLSGHLVLGVGRVNSRLM